MSSPQVVYFETLRSLANGSISTNYAAVGTPFTHPIRIICITNNTDGDMIFSTDASTDMLFLAKGSFKLFDLTTNRANHEQFWCLPTKLQFYVKYSAAPMSGSVYIEALYGG